MDIKEVPKQEWKQNLLDNGYSVKENVITPQKAEEYVKRAWDWLEGLGTGIKRDDIKTQKTDNWPWGGRGIIEYPSPSHEQWVWDARCEPNVIKTFEEIWGTP